MENFLLGKLRNTVIDGSVQLSASIQDSDRGLLIALSRKWALNHSMKYLGRSLKRRGTKPSNMPSKPVGRAVLRTAEIREGVGYASKYLFLSIRG